MFEIETRKSKIKNSRGCDPGRVFAVWVVTYMSRAGGDPATPVFVRDPDAIVIASGLSFYVFDFRRMESPMLVLSRNAKERIFIGPEITITIVRIGPGVVRIGIDAPKSMDIVREELLTDEKSEISNSKSQILEAAMA